MSDHPSRESTGSNKDTASTTVAAVSATAAASTTDVGDEERTVSIMPEISIPEEYDLRVEHKDHMHDPEILKLLTSYVKAVNGMNALLQIGNYDQATYKEEIVANYETSKKAIDKRVARVPPNKLVRGAAVIGQFEYQASTRTSLAPLIFNTKQVLEHGIFVDFDTRRETRPSTTARKCWFSINSVSDWNDFEKLCLEGDDYYSELWDEENLTIQWQAVTNEDILNQNLCQLMNSFGNKVKLFRASTIECSYKLGTIQSRVDIKLFVTETSNPIVVLEGKTVDNWPVSGTRNAEYIGTATLKKLWGVECEFLLRTAITQLVCHMGASKNPCGILYNGDIAHFCTMSVLPSANAIAVKAAGPYQMSSPKFWRALIGFVEYAKTCENLDLKNVEVMQANAEPKCDDPDRTGDGSAPEVPSLPDDFNFDNFQPMIKESKRKEHVDRLEDYRPVLVWKKQVEDQDVVVKAVVPQYENSIALTAELNNEAAVYDDIRSREEKGEIASSDFAPKFVNFGKLPGFRRVLVTKYAGESLDKWEPQDETEIEIVKQDALNSLTQLHEAGYQHGDVALRNFVVEPSTKRVRVVDFGHASKLTSGSLRDSERKWLECLLADKFDRKQVLSQ